MTFGAPTQILAQSFFSNALRRAERLLEEATVLADNEYRSDAPRIVAVMIAAVAERALRGIREEWSEFCGGDQVGAVRNGQVWDGLVRSAGSHLRFLHGALAGRVPGALSRLLDTIVGELGLGAAVLLREKWNYNYSVYPVAVGEWYRQPLSGLLGAAELDQLFGQAGSVYCIGFPALERDNVLLHAAIAHEVGHLAVEKWLRANDDNSRTVIDELSAEAKRIHPGSSSAQQDIELYQKRLLAMREMQRVRRRFLQEYGADAFAVELFGPSAVFAMTSIAISQGIDAPANARTGYPAWRDRLQLALRWLSESEVGETWRPLPQGEIAARVEAQLVELDQLLANSSATVNPVIAAAEKSAQRALQQLRRHIVSLVRNKQLGPNEISAQAYVLTARLAAHVPPNDVGSNQLAPEPPSLPAIMNAAWYYVIGVDGEHDLANGLPSGMIISRLNRLVLKALDDVVLLRDFARFRREVK